MALVKHSMKREIELVNNELEWLEPEFDVHPGAAKRIERLKKTFTQIVCTYCGRQLTCEERSSKEWLWYI